MKRFKSNFLQNAGDFLYFLAYQKHTYKFISINISCTVSTYYEILYIDPVELLHLDSGIQERVRSWLTGA